MSRLFLLFSKNRSKSLFLQNKSDDVKGLVSDTNDGRWKKEAESYHLRDFIIPSLSDFSKFLLNSMSSGSLLVNDAA
jgi:hypothetical protein